MTPASLALAFAETDVEKAAKGQPRQPAGTPIGGQFAPKGGSAGGGYAHDTPGGDHVPAGGHGLQAPHLGLGAVGGAGLGYFPMKPPPLLPAGAKAHPKAGETGKPVMVHYPTSPSDKSTWANPKAAATFVPGGAVPKSLNGVPMKSWDAPTTAEGWAKVDGQNHDIGEGPMPNHPDKRIGTGVIVVEPDGRVWITRPTNSFGGYVHTMPKGGVEPGLSGQANAIKEAFEETGLKVKIKDVLGDFERDTSVARYYIAERVGGTPADMGWETQAMRLVPAGKIKTFLNRQVDKDIADVFAEYGARRSFAKLRSVIIGVEFAKYDGKQERWPAGSPLGGQWKGQGSGGITLPPKVGSDKNPQHAKKAAALFEIAKTGDKAAFDEAFKKVASGAVNAAKKKEAGAPLNYHDKESLKLAQYGAQLHADMQSVPKVQAAAASISGPEKLSSWTKVGAKPGGSAAGAVYKDSAGQSWLVKGYGNDDMAKNEVTAAKLMHAAGIPAPEMKLVDLGGEHKGGIGVASKMVSVSAFHPAELNAETLASAQSQFAVHAMLANWDVAGLSHDNMVLVAGTPTNIDPGGALLYRAQGTPKGDAFGKTVTEWDTLRDKHKNPQAAEWFGSMTASQLAESAAKVKALDPDTIKKIVDAYGPGDAKTKAHLVDTLVARRADLLKKAGLDAAELETKAPTPTPTPKPAATPHAGTTQAPMPETPTFTAKPGKQYIVDYYNKETEVLKMAHELAMKTGDINELNAVADGKSWATATSPNAKKMQAYHQSLTEHFMDHNLPPEDDTGPVESIRQKQSAPPEPAPTATIAASAVKPTMPDFSAFKKDPEAVGKSAATKGDFQTHNAKIDHIEGLAKSGDVTGILALGYSTNTYGKIQAKAANDALAALGSPDTVESGQKKNQHPKITGLAPIATPVSQIATSAPAKAAPALPVFTAAKLPNPPDFANWNGPGKGLSSKANINAANQALAAHMLAVASKGDEKALDGLTFTDINTGKESPVHLHPSVHIREFFGDLKANIKEQKYGSALPTFTYDAKVSAGSVFDALDKQFPELTGAEAAAAPKKIGRYAILGNAHGITEAGLALDYINHATGDIKASTLHAESLKGYNKLPSLQKTAIKSYTGSSYGGMNQSLAAGKASSGAETAVQGIINAMHPLPKGLILSRKIGGSAGQSIAEKFKKDPSLIGKIIQDPAISSTALNADVWSGAAHLKIIVGEGVHGIYVGKSSAGVAISNHPGEYETLLPPNTRFVVLNVSGPTQDKHGNWGFDSGYGSQAGAMITVLALPNAPIKK